MLDTPGLDGRMRRGYNRSYLWLTSRPGLFDQGRQTMSEQQLDPEAQKSEHLRHYASAASGWMKWWAINGRALRPIGDRMCELAQIRPGQRVLDVATGLGEPALIAAQWVGPTGHVLATDIAPEMLDFGRSRAVDMALGNL